MGSDNIEGLSKKFDEFLHQYEIDMRGDTNINGNIGIIGNIREIKKRQHEYPSIIWLLKNKTATTIGVILFVFLFLNMLYDIGMLRVFLVYFGVPIP